MDAIRFSTLAALALTAGALRPALDEKVELGAEVHASVASDSGRLRCEPAIGMSGERVMVSWNDSWGGAHGSGTGVAVGWSVSTDGGRTFRAGGFVAERDGEYSGADSRIAVAPNGDFFLMVLEWNKPIFALRLYRSPKDDFGTLVEHATPLETEGDLIDKPDFSIDANGTMRICFTSPRGIEVVRSTDGGRGWSDPIVVSGEGSATRTGSAVRSDGDNVLVAWYEGGSDGLTDLWVARSADGGETFAAPRRVVHLEQALAAPEGYRMAYGQMGTIGTDAGLVRRAGAAGHFALVAIEGHGAGSRVLYLSSEDGGATWSAPERVDSGPDDAVKVFPSVAEIAGRVGVLDYDRRNDGSHDTSTDVYLSLQTKGGGWTDHRITTVSSKWSTMEGDEEHAPIQRNVGDYISLTADGNRFACAWTDGREGESRILVRTGTVE